MKPRLKNLYMKIAKDCSEMSRAIRLKVGCVIIKDDNIISFSWNGTPAGWDNNCENKEWMPGTAGEFLNPQEIVEQYPYTAESDYDNAYLGRYRLKTKPEVLHAERNALDKLAKNGGGAKDASLFTTHSPCLECAKSIYGAGIKEIYYTNDYRSYDGIDFLKKCGIKVEKINE